MSESKVFLALPENDQEQWLADVRKWLRSHPHRTDAMVAFPVLVRLLLPRKLQREWHQAFRPNKRPVLRTSVKDANV